MAGIRAFRKIQLGPETTPGTAVSATTYWRGIGTIQDNLETVFPQEDIGILPGTDHSYIPRVEAMLNLESTEATFEQLPYLFEMGIESVTPTTDVNGSIYTYTMPIETTDINESTDLGTYTIEGGDNQQAERFAYGFARSITISGNAGEALMMSAEIVGRQVGSTDFTASLSIPTVEDILFSKGVLYIEDTDTYPADTQVSNTLLSATLSINTGWIPVYTADGNIYFSFVKQAMPEVTLEVTFEHNASAVTEIANWRAGTARSIRLDFSGSDDGHYLYLDLVGKWDNFSQIGEQDGNDVVTGTFRARYNSTAGAFFAATVGNTNASLT
jgi:hypothetical protein